MKRIVIEPTAHYAGIGFTAIGAFALGLGLGALHLVLVIFGMVALALGLFIVIGLFKYASVGSIYRAVDGEPYVARHRAEVRQKQ